MITGWKDIEKHTDFSRNTLLKLVKDEKFPLRYIATKPVTTKQAIQEWFENRLRNKS
jgi:predicted DNA-binding transcriptional regulator AlpA